MQLQSPAKIIRFIVLCIGFALFVVVSYRSAQTITNQTTHHGKPYQLPSPMAISTAPAPNVLVDNSASQQTMSPAPVPVSPASTPQAEMGMPAMQDSKQESKAKLASFSTGNHQEDVDVPNAAENAARHHGKKDT
jgi:hypothetical protein